MATLRPSYLARKRACKTETTSWSAHEAAAERPPCVRIHVPSSAASRPRSLRPHEGNRSPSGGNQQRWSTRPADHSTSRHDPRERLGGLSSAALEPHSQPATHALPSQQSSPSTPECKEINHQYQCRSGRAGRVMRSTVHEARQGKARGMMVTARVADFGLGPSVPPTGPSKLRLQAGKFWRFWGAETPISQKRRP